MVPKHPQVLPLSYLKTGSLDSTRLKDLLLPRIHTFFKQHLDLYDFTFIFPLVHVPLMNF